ncbi:MAG TPA: HIT family protein [Burkholderiales bacterium]|nr:HIT family protein [Burkholderiales bacterium]
MNSTAVRCALCDEAGGEIVWSDRLARVVDVKDEDHPAFCRVILQWHAREMTDLDEADRAGLMRIVFAVERAQRTLLNPDKINLACFGNMVAHLHWHVIPRFRLDPHYPNPVWGSRTAGKPRVLPERYWERFNAELTSQLD